MTEAPNFAEQAMEADLHALGLRDLYERAVNGKIKRSDHDIERYRTRLAAAEAGAATLQHVAERATARSKKEAA